MDDATGKRDRSPSFPQIPLGEAVERLTAFENYFRRHPASIDKAGLAWGLKQVDHILAALRYYGFTEYAGHSGTRQVTLSQDGRNLLRVQQESTRREILRRAALRPKEIAKFWQSWGADRPPDPVCIEELVMRNGFSDRGAPLFLRTYDATISFAGLADSDKIPTSTQDDDVELGGVGEHEDDLVPDPPPPPPPAGQRKVPVMEGERELTTGLLSKNSHFRLIVSGHVGVKEIERLIRKLELDKEILADERVNFDHPNIKNASIASKINPDGSASLVLTVLVDIDERGNSREAREIEAIVQDWLLRNPAGSAVKFDHIST